jgi:hypothetical protein
VADVEVPINVLTPELKAEAMVVREEGETVVVRGWRPKRDEWEEKQGGPSYLSVNAASLDHGQEGLDVRKWHENGWIGYFEYLKGTRVLGTSPFEGGIY